jgi:hypothetical protein
LEEYFGVSKEALEKRLVPTENVDEFGETLMEDIDPIFIDSQEDDLVGCRF